jgi:hypothetical protein
MISRRFLSIADHCGVLAVAHRKPVLLPEVPYKCIMKSDAGATFPDLLT